MFNLTKSVLQKSLLKVILIIFILSVIGLSVIDDYGVSWDETVHIKTIKYNFELITKNQPIPGDLKYYGNLFDFASEAIFQGKEFLKEGFSYNPLQDSDLTNDELGYTRVLSRIKVKHIFTFLISLVTYVSVAGMVGILAGVEYAWLGPVVLALFPIFWGHSFFNPKDIPFAAMFTLGIFCGSCLVDYYLKTARTNIKAGINRITIYSIVYGILVGLVTGIRIGALFLLIFVALTHLITGLGMKGFSKNFLRFWTMYGLMFIAWMITTIIIYPASWSNPFDWFWETLQYLSHHGWGGGVLFEGNFISGKTLPWYYLPKLLIITTPVIFQILFLLGFFGLILKYQELTKIQRACLVLVFLQIFFLPILAILGKSNIYDGLRQFIFIIPGIATISATAIAWLYSKISSKNVKIFAISSLLIILSTIIFDMIALHPYQYIYFNEIFGGLPKAHNQYDTDYWGLSLREGMEWINQNANPDSLVVVGGPLPPAKLFANPELRVIILDSENKEISKPFYYLAMPRYQYQNEFPDCPIVHQVSRQGVPLTIIKQCQ